MSRFEALESLTRVGLDVDEATQATLRRGQLMRELLRQPRFAPRSPAEQVLTLTAVHEGWLDDIEGEKPSHRMRTLLETARWEFPSIMAELDDGKLPANWLEQLRQVAQSLAGSGLE